MPGSRFQNPLEQSDDDEGVSKAEANRATRKESVVAGNYLRRTFTWTPEQLDRIDEIARKEGFSKNATARWLMDQGLIAYLEDGVRPELAEQEVRPEPVLKYQ